MPEVGHSEKSINTDNARFCFELLGVWCVEQEEVFNGLEGGVCIHMLPRTLGLTLDGPGFSGWMVGEFTPGSGISW